MKKIDRPLFKDFWERMLECLELLKTRKYRTCIRLTLIKNEHKDMPLLSDMEEFMNELLAVLPEYEYIRTHKPSRAILLVRKSLNKKTWINFPRFFELVNSNKDYSMEDYDSENIVGNE